MNRTRSTMGGADTFGTAKGSKSKKRSSDTRRPAIGEETRLFTPITPFRQTAITEPRSFVFSTPRAIVPESALHWGQTARSNHVVAEVSDTEPDNDAIDSMLAARRKRVVTLPPPIESAASARATTPSRVASRAPSPVTGTRGRPASRAASPAATTPRRSAPISRNENKFPMPPTRTHTDPAVPPAMPNLMPQIAPVAATDEYGLRVYPSNNDPKSVPTLTAYDASATAEVLEYEGPGTLGELYFHYLTRGLVFSTPRQVFKYPHFFFNADNVPKYAASATQTLAIPGHTEPASVLDFTRSGHTVGPLTSTFTRVPFTNHSLHVYQGNRYNPRGWVVPMSTPDQMLRQPLTPDQIDTLVRNKAAVFRVDDKTRDIGRVILSLDPRYNHVLYAGGARLDLGSTPVPRNLVAATSLSPGARIGPAFIADE